jgi:hypothetical protein
MAEKNPLLGSILFHSESLSLLGGIGLKYLESIINEGTSKDKLLKDFNAIKLSRSVEKGYCELMVFESIEQLIQH